MTSPPSKLFLKLELLESTFFCVKFIGMSLRVRAPILSSCIDQITSFPGIADRPKPTCNRLNALRRKLCVEERQISMEIVF